MTRILFFLIELPILAALASLFLDSPKARRALGIVVFILGLGCSGFVFIHPPPPLRFALWDFSLCLGTNPLGRLVLIFINLLGLLVALYSGDYAQVREKRLYYAYLLALVAFSNLAVIAADFILLIFAWGAGLALLYAFLSLDGGFREANKALYILGFADFSFVLGAGLYLLASQTTLMPQAEKILLNNPLAWLSFVLMLCGALAKAGCGPFHSWLPLAAQSAPLPVMAILPASLDKLLGIYLLSRISLDFFVLNNYACAMLLLIGSGTIIFAVFKALTQHDLRKLLSYHAISQVGYMVVGFGTANPLGIAGGIFHLLNNALYKSGLFLTIGAVGGQRQRFKIEELGGLAKYMPLTFICGLIFSLAISGVLPLNGFFSKWMLYQGALSGMSGAESIWLRLVFLFALVAAMFGSALTLASFIKFIHGLFLGQESEAANRPKEAPASMLLALGVLAGLCLILGVFPRAFLRIFILPVMPAGISFIGEWDSAGAYILLGAGLLAGAGFWLWMRSKKLLREDSCFTGAETVVAQAGFPATEFYRSIEELPATRALYRLLKIEALDLYNIIVGAANVLSYILFIFVDRLISMLTTTTGFLVLGLSWCFRRLHSGVLDLYLAWGLFGLGLLLFLLLR